MEKKGEKNLEDYITENAWDTTRDNFVDREIDRNVSRSSKRGGPL